MKTCPDMEWSRLKAIQWDGEPLLGNDEHRSVRDYLILPSIPFALGREGRVGPRVVRIHVIMLLSGTAKHCIGRTFYDTVT